MTQKIVLASVSPHRRRLLERLQIAFEACAPQTDETPITGEPPDARALRLAEEKAAAGAARFPDALVIGGDQTIAAGAVLFDKPGTMSAAVAQLKDMRRRVLRFYTAVALTDAASQTTTAELVSHTVRFRDAGDAEIEAYVKKEAAFDCAGGAQIEGLGVSLIEDIQGGDPTALIGLPLIALSRLLREKGVCVP